LSKGVTNPYALKAVAGRYLGRAVVYKPPPSTDHYTICGVSHPKWMIMKAGPERTPSRGIDWQ
jgi:hypothetical protein